MIAMLTQLVLLILGTEGDMKGCYKYFQANTIRTRRVLSLFFPGRELIGREAYKYSLRDLALAVGGLKTMAAGDSR